MTAALLLAAVLSAAPYTMHEWGTFTSIAAEDGAPIQWLPLSGPSDLPSFVHTMQRVGDGLRGEPRTKGQISASVRMETPVIYFYPREPIGVVTAARAPRRANGA